MRSERCLLSKSDRYFFVVVDCDESYLLSVELLSCLVPKPTGLIRSLMTNRAVSEQ